MHDQWVISAKAKRWHVIAYGEPHRGFDLIIPSRCFPHTSTCGSDEHDIRISRIRSGNGHSASRIAHADVGTGGRSRSDREPFCAAKPRNDAHCASLSRNGTEYSIDVPHWGEMREARHVVRVSVQLLADLLFVTGQQCPAD